MGNFSDRHHCQKSLRLRWNRWAQKGSIFLPDFQNAETMTLVVEGKEPEVIRCPVDINGFEYEIREASRCVKMGRPGSDRYTPQDSLALTRLMYDTRMSWGMKFVGEV